MYGGLEVRLDPWQVDYGAEIALEAPEEGSPEEVLAFDVELMPEAWRPIALATGATAPRVAFVYGVRRIEVAYCAPYYSTLPWRFWQLCRRGSDSS
jgi:hypothetical protein